MTTLIRFCTTAAAAATFALACGPALAQAFDAVRLYAAPPGQSGGSAGLAVIAGTEYAGSNERRTLVLPTLDYQWANGWFAGVGNGIGYNFSARPGLQFGLRVTADLGRKQSRSSALRGMGDVDPQAEIGGFFNYQHDTGFFLTTSLRRGAGEGGKGLVGDVGAGWSVALAPQWRMTVSGAMSAANADHMQTYFGVSAAQSAATGYARYAPGGGLRDASSAVWLSWQPMARLSVVASVGSTTLADDAKASPLTRRTRTTTGLVFVGYAF